MPVTVTTYPTLDATSYVSVEEFKAWADQRLKDYSDKTDDQIGKSVNQGSLHLDVAYAFPGYRKLKDQAREWPRELVWDSRGDQVLAIHQAVKDAACELAWRDLNGTELLPDPVRDSSGLVVRSKEERVGPISESATYDAAGYDFPQYPQVTALLARHGLTMRRGGLSVGTVERG